MEDGMEIKPFSTSFKEYEWAQSVTLSRESVAAAYRINPSLVWHSNTQTYASARDNARALYAECLGPDIQMIQQRFNAFLLPMIGADEFETYVEFDMQEKLKGSFEEQASIMQTATGRPWLLVDEARAYMNLPKLPDGQGEGLVVPLNVEVSGQANPGNDYSYPGVDNNAKKLEPCACKACKEQTELRIKGRSDKDDDEKVQTVLTEFYKRQARSLIPKISAGQTDFWNAERWDKELTEDLTPVLTEIADKHGKSTAEQLGSEYGTEVTRKYLATASEARAKKINEGTLKAINKELNRDFEEDEEPDIQKVFETRENTAESLAKSAAGAIASFATQEAAHQAISDGAPRVVGRVVEKEWITGANARPSHQAMNGNENFIIGRNPVREAICAAKVTKVLLSDSFSDKNILDLINLHSIPIQRVSTSYLDKNYEGVHQGIVAFIKPYEYLDLNEMIRRSKKVKVPIIIMLDGINDPHNLGAIIRSADVFNASIA